MGLGSRVVPYASCMLYSVIASSEERPTRLYLVRTGGWSILAHDNTNNETFGDGMKDDESRNRHPQEELHDLNNHLKYSRVLPAPRIAFYYMVAYSVWAALFKS